MTEPVVTTLDTKPDTFWASTPRLLTAAEIAGILSSALAGATLPGGASKSLPLTGLFQVQASHQKGRDGVEVAPDREALHRLAVSWCQTLASLPPKSLPRSQRPMIKILQRLTPEPTGNQALDRGRAMLLDGVVKTLWVPITSALVSALQSPE